jgi:hypothetical protein
MGTYTPKASGSRHFTIKEPTILPETARHHMKNKAILKSLVGPQSYGALPDI